MNNPLKNKVTTVFIPVKDVEIAKEWYANILGIEGEIMHGHLCVLDMDGTGIVLDEMPAWRNAEGEISPFQAPFVQFATNDIHASHKWMKENGVVMVTGIEHEHYFVFKDLDGNMLMVCQ
ncbi:VOC family protein [Ornithinibacillus californiensis]|uniref:VOC family protein n=1 Tax=Ornithinibacillus californiensis TaxID=161536 RepID=UPI00064E07FC|nr:VOC family protein [Ornithinibacillus californiensis]